MAATRLTCGVALLVLLLQPVPAAADDWNYAEQQYWAGMYGSTCADGPQSPVDINTTRMLSGGAQEILDFGGGHKLGPVAWNFHNATVAAVPSLDQGTWQLQLVPPYNTTARTIYFGFKFYLQHITLHIPSENTVDGEHFDMEAQLFHSPGPGQAINHQLITSVMLKVGADADKENGFLEAVRRGVEDRDSSTSKQIFVGNPYYYFYPRNRSYFALNGSLTVPPCSPAIWVIFGKATTISVDQLQYFRRAMGKSSPSRLSHPSTAEEPPKGVTCPVTCPALGYAWDRGIGMNVRNMQPLGTRWVKHVEMLVPAKTKEEQEEEAAAATGRGWWWFWVILGILAILLLAGCTVGMAMKDADDTRETWAEHRDEVEDDGDSESEHRPRGEINSRNFLLPSQAHLSPQGPSQARVLASMPATQAALPFGMPPAMPPTQYMGPAPMQAPAPTQMVVPTTQCVGLGPQATAPTQVVVPSTQCAGVAPTAIAPTQCVEPGPTMELSSPSYLGVATAPVLPEYNPYHH